ncbi:preprotein translocase subunit YajC [Kineosporia mesophila]|uniref:preprotein translocase subunit YajC n=1 Tax=Kineosporia mesophila TaxID=566012 RepID=UPI001E5E4A58|nr:preprotein translocase subunit YajC [Kineosporia mesophila]
MELIILAVPLLLLWLMVSRGRRQQRELVAQQESVTPGTRIMTTSGLFAEVVEVDSDAVVLEIAPGVRTRWSKRAIGQIVTADSTDGEQDGTDGESAGENTSADSPSTITGTTDRTGADRDGIRSESGYAPPPNSDVTDGSTGTDGR